MIKKKFINIAKNVISLEIKALQNLRKNINNSFNEFPDTFFVFIEQYSTNFSGYKTILSIPADTPPGKRATSDAAPSR